MAEVTLSGYIQVSRSDLDAVLEELPNHIELTREEPGCLEFQVTRDKTDPATFHVSERFESTEAFSNHQRRVLQSKWGAITAQVARHYTINGLDAK